MAKKGDTYEAVILKAASVSEMEKFITEHLNDNFSIAGDLIVVRSPFPPSWPEVFYLLMTKKTKK